MLTGRYQLKPMIGGVRLLVEENNGSGFFWRKATRKDLKNLEPEIKAGWLFREERSSRRRDEKE